MEALQNYYKAMQLEIDPYYYQEVHATLLQPLFRFKMTKIKLAFIPFLLKEDLFVVCQEIMIKRDKNSLAQISFVKKKGEIPDYLELNRIVTKSEAEITAQNQQQSCPSKSKFLLRTLGHHTNTRLEAPLQRMDHNEENHRRNDWTTIRVDNCCKDQTTMRETRDKEKREK